MPKINRDNKKEEDPEFDLEKELEKLEESSRRELNIIAWFLREKEVDLRNKEQLQTAIKRHIRASLDLVPFSDEQLIRASALEKDFELWTLESLMKRLTK